MILVFEGMALLSRLPICSGGEVLASLSIFQQSHLGPCEGVQSPASFESCYNVQIRIFITALQYSEEGKILSSQKIYRAESVGSIVLHRDVTAQTVRLTMYISMRCGSVTSNGTMSIVSKAKELRK